MDKETAAARATAALLETAKICLPFNLLFAAAGVWLMQGAAAVLWAVAVLAAVYLHIRIAFDTKLFRYFSDGLLGQEELDKVLFDLNLRKQTGNRDMQSRCRGALRLWKQILLLTAVQGAGLAGYVFFAA